MIQDLPEIGTFFRHSSRSRLAKSNAVSLAPSF